VAKYFDRIRKAKDRENVPVILVGNKIDIERQVSRVEGEEKAKALNALFLETSAKTNDGISDVFKQLVRKIRNDQKAHGIQSNKSICAIL